MLIGIDYFPYPGEAQFLGFVRANYLGVFDRFLSQVRERIEGVFYEIQNTGRNLERLLRKTVEGRCTHVAAKMASHTLRLLLRKRFGIDVLTFQQEAI